jgi:hypothetical protein
MKTVLYIHILYQRSGRVRAATVDVFDPAMDLIRRLKSVLNYLKSKTKIYLHYYILKEMQ